MGQYILAASLCLLILGNLVESAPVCKACDEESERIVKGIQCKIYDGFIGGRCRQIDNFKKIVHIYITLFNQNG